MSSPAGVRHQQVAFFLARILASYAEMDDLGTILIPPFQMKLPDSGREPDVLFLARAHLGRLRETYLDGPADLVAEIVSPESKHRDRVVKLREYADGGVEEYWLIDPEERTAAFYQRNAQGAYTIVPPDPSDIYHSRAVAGFRLNLAWLRQDPLPQVERTVLAIAGERFLRHMQGFQDTAP